MERSTIAQQLECLNRELKMRRHVYPKRVADRKMTQDKADYEIMVMEDIHAKLSKERTDGELAL